MEEPKKSYPNLKPGAVVSFDKKVWRVAATPEQGLVEIIRPGLPTIRSVKVGELFLLGDFIKPVFQTKDPDEVSAEAIAKARVRLQLVEEFLGTPMSALDLEDAAGRADCHPTTFLRWVDAFVLSGGKFSTLIPASGRYGNSNARIKGLRKQFLEEETAKHYLGSNRLKRGRVWRKIANRCDEAGIPRLGRTTVYRYLENLPGAEVVAARVSKRAAREMFGPHPQKATTGEFPLHIIQLDHTMLDIFIKLGEFLLKRPWITVAIDTFTRMIVGFYLSFDPPSALSVGLCLYRVMTPKEEWLNAFGIQSPWPVHGRPYIWLADNGKDFRGYHLQNISLEHRIVGEFRPVKEPQYGAYIERLMGTLALEMEVLPGATFRDVALRKEFAPEALATLSLDQLEKILLHFFVELYHHGPHSGLGDSSPISRWREGWANMDLTNPLRQHVLVQPSPDLLLGLLPSFTRTFRSGGVYWRKRRFYDQCLEPYLHGRRCEGPQTKYRFHYDSRNVRFIYMKDPESGEIIRLPAKDNGLSDISEWEWEAEKSDAARKAELSVDREMMAKGEKGIESTISVSKESASGKGKKRGKRSTKRPSREVMAALQDLGQTSASLNHFEVQQLLKLPHSLPNTPVEDPWSDIPTFEPEGF
jgi:putative transposase